MAKAKRLTKFEFFAQREFFLNRVYPVYFCKYTAVAMQIKINPTTTAITNHSLILNFCISNFSKSVRHTGFLGAYDK